MSYALLLQQLYKQFAIFWAVCFKWQSQEDERVNEAGVLKCISENRYLTSRKHQTKTEQKIGNAKEHDDWIMKKNVIILQIALSQNQWACADKIDNIS